ncbi:MAG: type II secretion system protein GspL [Pseudohongiella sp.]|nr:type II secretion system protein GspL [Pseudohongiella sp.]
MSTVNTLLRLRITLRDEPLRCEWALLDNEQLLSMGEAALADLPTHQGRIEVILPAGDVFITKLALPNNARTQGEAVLAYAVEEQTAGDPKTNQVSWLGVEDSGMHTLAVVDKPALQRWRTALTSAGIRSFALRCETLMLPRVDTTWSMAWNGVDGFVRSADHDGWATDCGDSQHPPVSLLLAVAQHSPDAITLYTLIPGCKPDLSAWSTQLGIPVNDAGAWQWYLPVSNAGPDLSQQAQRWQFFDGLLPRLRPALWLVVCTLLFLGAAIAIDQIRLESEQRELRAQMNSRFRSVFPDAVAVINPALQMQRQLTGLRQLNGIADNSDFLPMLQHLAQATQSLPAGHFRSDSREGGRMTVEFVGNSDSDGLQMQARLQQAGLRVEQSPGSAAFILIISLA